MLDATTEGHACTKDGMIVVSTPPEPKKEKK
jgi:hypothetical protein